MLELGVGISAYNALKDLIAYIQKTRKDIPQELRDLINEVQEKVLSLQAERVEHLEELQQLREKMSLKASMEWDKDSQVYWMKNEKGEREPFCPKCFDGEGRAARLRRDEPDDYLRCTVCDFFASWGTSPIDPTDQFGQGW